MIRTIFVMLWAVASCHAADEAPRGADLKLVSENAVIAPGQAFEIGVEVVHRPGFHSYWQNPGVVGFATKIDWDLPEGFTAGPIVWPTPELVDMAGHAAHGFHRDVLLTVTITPPDTLAADELALRARIAWMACSNACHPGNEVFTLTLPVGPKPLPDPATAARFAQSRAARPAPLAGWDAKLLSPPGARVIRLQLTRTDPAVPPLEAPYFFSTDGQVADGRPQVTEPETGVWVFSFQRAEHGPKDARGLPGLIAHGPENARLFGSIDP